jgi:hypothetical protein
MDFRRLQMIRRIQLAVLCILISLPTAGCAPGRIRKLIKKLHEDPVKEDGSPSKTMRQLAEYGAMIEKPVLDALTSDEREYNVSLVGALVLVEEGIEPEVFANLLAHPGRGVGEAAEAIVVDPKTRNLTYELSKMLVENDPRKSSQPRHAEEIYRRILVCLGEAGRPPAIPALVKTIRQPNVVTRRLLMKTLSSILARLPFSRVRRSLDARHYNAGIYFVIRSILLTDTDAEVRYHASRVMEAFLETGYGLFARSEDKRDMKKEAMIIDRYDYYVVYLAGLNGYPKAPSSQGIARRLRLISRNGKLKVWKPGQRR